MKVTFLGTRGYIDATTRRHKRHTSTLVTYKGKRLLIDCGLDWLGKLDALNPDAIIITHAHPDHAWGLRDGAPCPVYATRESWQLMANYPIPLSQRMVVSFRQKLSILSFYVEPFSVLHSLIAPAVGYRVTAGKRTIFCAHDLIAIKQRSAALRNIDLYIGDGASLVRPIIRRKGNKLFGHTTIRAQLGWCQQEDVSRAIFTHCGSQIVESDGRTINAQIRTLARERDVKASIAYDGMEVVL